MFKGPKVSKHRQFVHQQKVKFYRNSIYRNSISVQFQYVLKLYRNRIPVNSSLPEKVHCDYYLNITVLRPDQRDTYI